MAKKGCVESEVKWVKSATKEGGKERLCGKRSQVGEISEQRKVAKKGCVESRTKGEASEQGR